MNVEEHRELVAGLEYEAWRERVTADDEYGASTPPPAESARPPATPQNLTKEEDA